LNKNHKILPGDCVAQPGGEIVEDDLWSVMGELPPVHLDVHLPAQLDITEFELSCRTVRQVDQQHAIGLIHVLVDDNDVCVLALFFAALYNFLDGSPLPEKGVRIRDDFAQFPAKRVGPENLNEFNSCLKN
jgi:hypothetical protein